MSVLSAVVVLSFAEAVSFSGRTGTTMRTSRIASETSKTDAFEIPITPREYTKLS